jgi:NitT/TauT family transport system substrate-binding protein
MKASYLRGACVLALTVGMATAAAAADKLTLVLNWTTSGEHTAVFYADKAGWFKKADLDVKIEQGQGSTVAAQRVGAGSADIGIADLGAAMVAKGAGADLKAVMNIYANSPYQMYWLKSSGMTGIKDFPGHKFGNPPADAARAMWPALAKVNGLEPNSISWVNIAPNAKVSALKTGDIDGTTYFANYHHVMESAFGDDLRWVAWSDLGLNPYGNSFVVHGAYLKKNPDAVKRFVSVMQKAHLYCASHAQECVDVLPGYASGLKVENEIKNWNGVVKLMTDKTSTTVALGYFVPERVKADRDLVTEVFNIKKPFAAEEVYSNDYLDMSVKMVPPNN